MRAQAYALSPFALPQARRPPLSRDIQNGALAGIVAGLAMAVCLMALFAAFLGKSIFYPVGIVAESALAGSDVIRSTLGALIAGIFVHELGPSMVWGIVFGVVVWVARPRRGASLLLLGLLLGATAQIVDVDLVLPALSTSLQSPLASVALHPHDTWTTDVPVVVSWIAHLAYGTALSIYPWRYDPLARTFD
jgi:hypothetical protein